MDAIRYVARRYATTPENVLRHYLVQTGIVKSDGCPPDGNYELAPNELTLFRDLGVQPTIVEIQ